MSTENNAPKKTNVVRTIPIYVLLLGAVVWLSALPGKKDPAAEVKPKKVKMFGIPDVTPDSDEVVKPEPRGFQKNDVGPIIQWLERTRLDHHITSRRVEIVPVAGAKSFRFIDGLDSFLVTKGYIVTKSDSVAKKPDRFRDVSFEVKDSIVLVYVGIL